jgi:NAD-dependent deacetylase
MEQIERALWSCDRFVAIGTSGLVYPAAAFVQYAAARGTDTLELNLDASEGSSDFRQSRRGPATRLVPEWVAEVLTRDLGVQ